MGLGKLVKRGGSFCIKNGVTGEVGRCTKSEKKGRKLLKQAHQNALSHRRGRKKGTNHS